MSSKITRRKVVDASGGEDKYRKMANLVLAGRAHHSVLLPQVAATLGISPRRLANKIRKWEEDYVPVAVREQSSSGQS